MINRIKFIMKLVMVYHQTMIDPLSSSWGCCSDSDRTPLHVTTLGTVSFILTLLIIKTDGQTADTNYWSVRNNLTQITIIPGVQCTQLSGWILNI